MAADEAGKEVGGAADAELRLAEHFCARLCHDIAGGLGALMGSLELAREQGEMAVEAMEFVGEAGQALVARLRLLRAAWVGEGVPLTPGHLAELAKGLPQRGVALDCSLLPPETAFGPEVGRVVLNLVLLAAEALRAGGTVWLEPAGADLLVGVAGPRASWPAGLAAALAGEMAIAGPRELQAPFTVRLCRAAGLRLSLLHASEAADAAAPLLLGLTAARAP